MTNRKKLMKIINELNNEELAELARGQICPEDNFDQCIKSATCKDCILNWLEKKDKKKKGETDESE